MTHKDIFTKFMIEYDKANVTSSYPSLTEYEIATFLDKAYDTLISQKVTGNNIRRAPFEADIKSISDLQPLVTSRLLFLGETGSASKANNLWPKTIDGSATVRTMPDNMRSTKIPNDMLYFVAASVPLDMHEIAGWQNEIVFDENNVILPMDNKDSDYQDKSYKRYRLANVNLTSHQIAKNFYASSSNIPWVKNPIAFLENDGIFLLLDPCIGTPELTYEDPDTKETKYGEWMLLTYIRKPFKFTKDLTQLQSNLSPEKHTDVEIKYTIDANYYLRINVDEYHGDDKRKIHINDITVLKENDAVNPSLYTYYVEFNTLRYDPSTLSADDFVEGDLLFGKIVKRCKAPDGIVNPEIYDDSFKLGPADSVAFIRKNLDGTTCSLLFVLSYNDVYKLIKSKISDPNAYQEFGDEYYTTEPGTDENSMHYNLKALLLVPLDVDPGDYYDLYSNAYDNLDTLSYSEYTLKNVSVHSGTILKDSNGHTLDDYYTFELNDVAAEELVSLAITYALENVESPRLNAHLGIRGLES